MPAHNEALGIAASLKTIQAQLGPRDRVLVVADNCSDTTADVARHCGAHVIERHHATLRGKGYALDHGIRYLADQVDRHDVVVVIDADCTVWPGTLDRLASAVQTTGRAVQSLDLMQAPAGAGLKTRIAEFAWLVRNQVRPLGWHRLGAPCQLMGTGMAFPWQVLAEANLASGALAEDMQLGLQLAERGEPPLFCPDALVTSEFPLTSQAQQSQRTRWEHGHLTMLLAYGPALLFRALRLRRLHMAALALDLLVPPLVSLVMLLVLGTLLSAGLAAGAALAVGEAPAIDDTVMTWVHWAASGTGSITAFLTLLAAVAISISLAWHRHGRHILSRGDWLSLPSYVMAKLPIYTRFIRGRKQQSWVRADRHEQPPSS
jgi:cellulose synthase/poly-beta-1,6-N-acetylglucosamine synthase-like glycosyltransferase